MKSTAQWLKTTSPKTTPARVLRMMRIATMAASTDQTVAMSRLCVHTVG